MNNFNAVEVKDSIVAWIRDWFEENGNGCNAVIGISGGKDSSVVAALCAEAIGNDRVIGVLMPDGKQADINDSIYLVNYLNIHCIMADISDAVCGVKAAISEQLKLVLDTNISQQSAINLPPRIRMATLYAISQSVNGRVACTDNASEAYIGYSTRWGDNVGDFCPLASLTSEEVVAVGDACGLPYELTHKVPSDGLCGKTDEDRFGFTYEVLNKYIRTGVCENKETRRRIDEMHRKNLFKLQPIPRFQF